MFAPCAHTYGRSQLFSAATRLLQPNRASVLQSVLLFLRFLQRTFGPRGKVPNVRDSEMGPSSASFGVRQRRARQLMGGLPTL